MDSENIEPLSFPLLFPSGERGYTNASKGCINPDGYAMARLLIPEKNVPDYLTAQAPETNRSDYLTAQARYAPFENIDSRTGEPFAPTEDQCQIEEHHVQDVSIHCLLRVNCFMLIARLSQ